MEPFISAAKDINVKEIMDAIQKKIQDKKDAGLLKQREIDEITEMELQPLPDFLEIPNTYEPHLYPNMGQYTAIPTPTAEKLPRAEMDTETGNPNFSPNTTILAQSKEKILETKQANGLANTQPAQDASIPNSAGEEIQETGLAKSILKKIRNLLSPLIRFMTRPMYLELQNAMIQLRNVIAEQINEQKTAIGDLKIAVSEQKTAIVEMKSAMVDTQNQMLKHIPIVLQSSEYIKLLHNASNNIIVEASKLKTEEELLKTKLKIIEDKMEFLENRERALEKKLSPS